MKQLRTIVLIFLLILIYIPISSATSLFPHKPLYCFNNCHGERGFSYGDNGGDDCGNCHTLYFNNSNFVEQHDTRTCSGCHKVTDKDSFHILHVSYNVSCSTCHIDNTIPDNTYSNCLSCHIQGLHIVHGNKSCSICHTVNVVKPNVSNETVKNASKAINETKTIYPNTSIINYKKITIYEILMNLYKAIIGDIYGKNNMDNNVAHNDSSNSNDWE